ncbi:MAG: hypothetical protein ACLRSW_02715 [Christensenellaceae bacterium]
MFLSAAADRPRIVQPGNSTGIDAPGGSGDLLRQNKGKSIEARMKKWTIICLVILVIFSISSTFFSSKRSGLNQA